MKNVYSVNTSNITTAQFDFSYPKENMSFNIAIHDKISIDEINDNSVSLSVCRYISYNETEMKMLNVVFTAVINTDKQETVESVIEKIREEKINLDSVYAKISTVIAEITSTSVFGPLVTVPFCDCENVEIENS